MSDVRLAEADEPSGMAPVILIEFMNLINDMGGAHYFSTEGLWHKRHEVLNAMNADPVVAEGNCVVMAGPPGDETNRPYLTWPNRQLVDEKLGRNGSFSVQLSNNWIIGLVAAWEYRYRKETANLLGLPTANDLVSDEMGDLTLIRNDVVHHQGIATARNMRRCLSLHWFSDGDVIRVDVPHIYEFQQKFAPQIGAWTRRAAEREWEALGQEPPWKYEVTVMRDVMLQGNLKRMRPALPAARLLLGIEDSEELAEDVDLDAITGGLFLVAVVLTYELAARTAKPFQGTLVDIEMREADFGSEIVPVNWTTGLQMLDLLRIHSRRSREVGAEMDSPTALRTALSLVLALTLELETLTGKDTEHWLNAMARWLPEDD